MKWLFLDLPVKRVKWITTVSEKTKEEILHYTKCDPNKIIVIDNPVDPCLHVPEMPSSDTIPTLLFLGTKQNKNLENCIPAIFNLPVKLRIIGEVSPQQEQMLKKFGISYSSVHHLGENELKNEYYRCDIVLFPSIYEGFGLPIIEAFAVGKPVITSDISPFMDIAKDAAVYVNPYSITSIRQGIQKLISSPELRNDKVLKGFERIKKYQVDTVLAKYQHLWGEVKDINVKKDL
jgi:glycosyltransferase involved in cell wall biosynthesis